MITYELTPYNIVFSMGSEIDQLCKICNILGMPDLTIFPEGTNTSRLLGIFSCEEVSFCWTGVQFLVFSYVCHSHYHSFQMLVQNIRTCLDFGGYC